MSGETTFEEEGELKKEVIDAIKRGDAYIVILLEGDTSGLYSNLDHCDVVDALKLSVDMMIEKAPN